MIYELIAPSSFLCISSLIDSKGTLQMAEELREGMFLFSLTIFSALSLQPWSLCESTFEWYGHV